MSECPCGRGRGFDACCGRVLRGERDAVTAEEVMRARYSAFSLGDAAYLMASWHPSTRPKKVRIDTAQRWTRLDVIRTARGGLLDDDGEVEFLAHYERAGQAGALHELSRFVRHDEKWVYLGAVDAELS
jgi:SEC-C motif domain protein